MNEIKYDDELLAGLFGAQPQPVFWVKPIWNKDKNQIIDFEYRYCNAELYRFSRLSKEQLLGKALSANPALDAQLHERFFSQILEVYQSGKTLEDSVYNPRLNKYYTYLRSKVQDGVLTVLQDRTLEYNTINDLEKKNALLDNILKHSPSGISVTEVVRDETGKIKDAITLLANDKAVEFTGIPMDTYLTKTVHEIEPGILDSPLYQMALSTLESGKPFHTQYYLESSKRWLELSVSKMDDNHLINVFTDISSTKEAQLKLDKGSTNLKTIFNAAQAGMFIFQPERDKKGEIVDFRFSLVNPSLAAYIGQKAEDLEGELGSRFFPGYLTNGVFDMYKQTYLTGQAQRKEVHYNVDGLDIYLDLQCIRIGDDVLVTFTDHTVAKKAQYQLEKTIEELKRSNANLEDFAHAASHDLKEPIRKINYFSERLKHQFEALLDEEGAKTFERLQVASERMRLLVDDLLEYSHVSMLPREFEEIKLDEKIQKVLDDLELVIKEKGAKITVGKLPVIKGYKRQIQQLFQNLVSNALKYSKPGIAPEISITSQLTNGMGVPENLLMQDSNTDYHLIEVKDNGIGFEQMHAERIFQMFQRLHGNSEYKGTGVGLSIARKVVQNHHGAIKAESDPGKGSTFKVYLPVNLGQLP